ncbi:MAG: hypothetical protein HFJ34_01775 [Clostridia bacterium]|nr:hypothetical protein [Clostridia bacterium]
MNLIEESFQNKEEKKKKRTTRIILIAIILVVIIIIAIISYLMYIQSTVMRLTIDGQANEKLKSLLVFESDGTIYAPIKEIAAYFGYDSFNGEYSEKSEVQSKCYVQSENEIANFELGQSKIYKLDLTKRNTDYEYEYIKKPVKAINGVLYISTEGLEKAFNISFDYNQETNRITIYTMPYLYKYYANTILDYGYTSLDNTFVNQKAILDNYLIVSKDDKQQGVIKVDGTTILEPKYDSITYLINTSDFLVENNKKVGIMSANSETKVRIMYDNIEIMDSDLGLYVVKQDNKYGVIDVRGTIKIYIENDEIGIDISKFSQNNIKNKYILADNLIPVKKDDLWALYDKNGNQLTDYKYDSFGYIASNNREAVNLLVIPNYNVLVACRNEKYTLINAFGSELIATVADDIYMTINGAEGKHYYIAINDKRVDAEEWMDSNGITQKTGAASSQTKNNSTANQNNNQSGNQNKQNNNEQNQQEESNNNGNNDDNEEDNNGNDNQNDNEEDNNNNDNQNDNENNDESNYDNGEERQNEEENNFEQ